MSSELTLFGDMEPDIVINAEDDCYEGVPIETIITLEQRAFRIKCLVHNATLEIGKELAEAKKDLNPYKDGGFERWVERKTDVTRAYAYQLMDTYNKFGVYTNSIHSQFSGTSMKILSLPNVPQSARDEALARAGLGEKITVKLSKEIAELHKQREIAEKNLIEAENEKAKAEADAQAVQKRLLNLEEASRSEIDALTQQMEALKEKMKIQTAPQIEIRNVEKEPAHTLLVFISCRRK